SSQSLIHGEPEPAPVAGIPERPHLLDDPSSVLRLPLPYLLYERIASDPLAVDALLCQLALHHDLSGDPGVVRSRQPQGFVALHPLPPDHDVLQKLLEGVAHVKRARHVGWREDDAERLAARARSSAEVAPPLPFGVP